jgi:excinuclease ABC subunit B
LDFELVSDFCPQGDQPEAIRQLVEGISRGDHHQTLLGVTGSGKTFTMANVIAQVKMPTLVISHNKTLAAQLYQEFKDFFPKSRVEYFVSFYDYYQPEAYIPATDTYIEKTSDINDEIDRLRLKATSSLLARRDVIIVASVSCIYNIGSPAAYAASTVYCRVGQSLDRDTFLHKLRHMRYTRNDAVLERGAFRVRGDVFEIQPAYEETGLRIETFGNEIERISMIDVISGKILERYDDITIFPAKHFINMQLTMEEACAQIESELAAQLQKFESAGKLLEAQRLRQRTRYDIEMLREVGYINGIENYSRILDSREPGSRPHSLLDFFGRPFLTIIDESHISIPQIGGMSAGDFARKTTLVEHGFRIPCALDNRPLTFPEFESLTDFVIYSSATPADYELRKSEGLFVEQIIRPTGLVDPPVEIVAATNQVDDLIDRLRPVVARHERALVTTLTKKMAEGLTEYLESLDFKVRYLHSDIQTLERTEILQELREGAFDVLVGINLLREGLDLPEVSFVAILDADKEGFLRSARSLIQIAGRAARNINSTIVLYADTITGSIKKATEEMERRRTRQIAHNSEHGITPQSTTRRFKERITGYPEPGTEPETGSILAESQAELIPGRAGKSGKSEKPAVQLKRLEAEMKAAAARLDFEKAARLRDRIKSLKGLA